MGLEANERHIRNYDNDETWHIDGYDRRSAAILARIGAKRIGTPYDGVSFDCTPKQAIEYIAELHGLNVEFRKRKKRVLSAEQREKLAERMRRINAERNAVLSDG